MKTFNANSESINTQPLKFPDPNAKWNKDLWQGLAKLYSKSNEFQEVLCLAPQIEEFLEKRKQQIKDDIIDKYTKKIIAYYHNKKDKSINLHDYLTQQLTIMQKTINTETDEACKKLLTTKTDLKTLMGYAACVYYDCEFEKMETALSFYRHRMSYAAKDAFYSYFYLKPIDNDKLIPNIKVNGSDVNHHDYYIERISSSNPITPNLGNLVGCCQHLGSDLTQGAMITRFGIESECAGFYTLNKRKKVSKEDDIKAMFLAYRGIDNVMVLDSIEAKNEYYSNPDKETMLCNMTAYFAKTLVEDHQIPYVYVGTGGRTPTALIPYTTLKPSSPVSRFTYFKDSKEQAILASQKIPFLPMLYMNSTVQQLMIKNKKSVWFNNESIQAFFYHKPTDHLVNAAFSLLLKTESNENKLNATRVRNECVKEFINQAEKNHTPVKTHAKTSKPVYDYGSGIRLTYQPRMLFWRPRPILSTLASINTLRKVFFRGK